MDELTAWLREQGVGVGTHVEFGRRAAALAAANADLAAFCQLLAGLSARFVFHYEDAPLPLDVGERALAKLVTLTESAAAASKRPAADQLSALNEIARADLLG